MASFTNNIVRWTPVPIDSYKQDWQFWDTPVSWSLRKEILATFFILQPWCTNFTFRWFSHKILNIFCRGRGRLHVWTTVIGDKVFVFSQLAHNTTPNPTLHQTHIFVRTLSHHIEFLIHFLHYKQPSLAKFSDSHHWPNMLSHTFPTNCASNCPHSSRSKLVHIFFISAVVLIFMVLCSGLTEATIDGRCFWKWMISWMIQRDQMVSGVTKNRCHHTCNVVGGWVISLSVCIVWSSTGVSTQKKLKVTCALVLWWKRRAAWYHQPVRGWHSRSHKTRVHFSQDHTRISEVIPTTRNNISNSFLIL